ncbi:MAG: DUF1573 domain-containing protein [Candidatus Omnitrophota bacterium]
MKILFIAFIVSLSLLQPLFSAEVRSQEQKEPLAEPDTWDFGRVKEGDIVKHEFILKNESARKIAVQDVNTSCGCTASKIKDKELAPGASTTIEVQFNSKGYSGEVKQYVYVHMDSLDKPIIRFIIKAQVDRSS